MAVLNGLEPQRVFYYFEEICKIPHGTFHTKRISDYCVKFAKEHGLRFWQDEADNVVICKSGSTGYETSETVILQGHLDMVCEKTSDSDHDFEREGLDIYVKDGYVMARNTSLGGDDGIAVAMALAVLESEELCHPPLEVVFTADEESGMGGAHALDLSLLTGRMLMNIDSEEEGILTVGCAGGCRFDTRIPVKRERRDGVLAEITIDGLTGGHSGVEIHRQRGNAHKMMGRLLGRISRRIPFHLVCLEGGSRDNVIAKENTARILIGAKDAMSLDEEIEEMERVWKKEFGGDEPDLTVQVRMEQGVSENACTGESTRRAVSYLASMPDGVTGYSRSLRGQVETSLNAGIVETAFDSIKVGHLIRSSLESKKKALEEQLFLLAELAGGKGSLSGDYPAWEYRESSKLKSVMEETYHEMYGERPQIVSIHAGLECGLFVSKKPELDCVSFGPNILDVHSVKERLDIASVERSFQYLLRILEKCK